MAQPHSSPRSQGRRTASARSARRPPAPAPPGGTTPAAPSAAVSQRPRCAPLGGRAPARTPLGTLPAPLSAPFSPRSSGRPPGEGARCPGRGVEPLSSDRCPERGERAAMPGGPEEPLGPPSPPWGDGAQRSKAWGAGASPQPGHPLPARPRCRGCPARSPRQAAAGLGGSGHPAPPLSVSPTASGHSGHRARLVHSVKSLLPPSRCARPGSAGLVM